MSDPNLEIIRGVNDAVADGNPRIIEDGLDPDVVWEHNLGIGSPEEGVYRGREEVMRLFERIIETWESIRPEPRSIERLGEGSYRIKGELVAKHRTSDTKISAAYEQQIQVRDGMLVKGSMKTGEMSL